MDFVNYLLDRIEERCLVRRISGRPITLKVDDSLCTEVEYNGDVYRIFIQKDQGKAQRNPEIMEFLNSFKVGE